MGAKKFSFLVSQKFFYNSLNKTNQRL